MKDNKLYKALRIIFLTLAILSLIFSLSKKFVRAEGSSNNTYRTTMPLYVSPVSGANQGKPSDIDLSGMRNALLNYLINDGFYSPSIKYITYEGKSETDPIIYVNAFSDYGSPNISNYPTLNLNSFTSESNFTFNITNGVYPMWYNYSTGACGMHTHSNTPFILNNYISLYYNGATPFYALIPNQFIAGYPLYIENDITYGNDVIFTDYANIPSEDSPTYSGSSIGGSGSGTFIPFDDGSGSGGDTSSGGSFDFDIDLDFDGSAIINSIDGGFETIGGQLDSLQGSVDGLGSSIGGLSSKIDSSNSKLEDIKGKLDQIKGELQSLKGSLVDSSDNKSWLEKIYLKIKDIYDYITEPFNQTKFNNGVQSLSIAQDVNTIKGDLNAFKSSFDVSPDDGDSLVFEIPFTFPYIELQQTAVIDFRVFESIRNIVVPVIVAFLCFSMVWSLIRSIPGIFHGTSPDGDS